MQRYLDQELGNYRLTCLLGSGGFADVYLGEHMHLGTQAAIKVHRARMEGADLERFEQEARTIAHLSHPHIVRVLDYGVQDGVAFLVMEYAPRGTLRDLHPAGTIVPLETVVQYVKQIAAALQYAHDQKLVHRDVKPENMLLDARYQVLLSDFGIAVAAHTTRSLDTQDAIGTVSYMAPEHLKKKARPASDQYALAAIAYEWLCGSPPFDGLPIEVALQHVTDPVPSPRDKLPGLPLAVEQVLLRALAKEPEQRFPNVQAFAGALEQAAQGAEREALSSRYVARPILLESVGEKPGSGLSQPPRAPDRSFSSDRRRQDPVAGSWSARSKGAIFAALAVLIVLGAGLIGVVAALHHTLPTVRSGGVQGPIGTSPGDWAEPNFDTQNTNDNIYEHTLNPQNVARLHQLWHVYTLTGSAYGSSFVLAGGRAYWLNNRAPVAVDTQTGQMLWPTQSGVLGCSTPAVADGHIYVGGGGLVTLDAHTGALIGQLPFNQDMGGFCPSSIAANGVVYGTAVANEVYAVDGKTNTLLWRRPLTDVTSTPAFADGVVYVSGFQHLYAIDASTGNLLWQTQSIGTGNTLLQPGSDYDPGFFTPVIGSHFVYATTGKQILAFPLQCSTPCSPAWAVTDGDGFRSGPSFANGVVYAVTGFNIDINGPLYAINGETGQVLWTADTTPAIVPPVLANGVLYQTDFFGNILAFAANGCDAKKCKPVWSTSIWDNGNDGTYSVRVVDGHLYALTVNGHFLAFGL
jgi:serine/threonine protein kinase/outer membrane protein assembly factor BamB